MKIALGVGVALSAALILYFGGQRILEQRRISGEITRLRDQLYRARVTADRCQRSLIGSESELLAFDERVAAMRVRVDSFEALDERGVALDQYDAYLETFDAYNDSVAAWEARKGQLRTAEAACRNVIREHNAAGDSLQSVLEQLGS